MARAQGTGCPRHEEACRLCAVSETGLYGDQARRVLDALLDKFADEGVDDIEDIGILRVRPLPQHGTPIEIVDQFGGKEPYMQAIHDLEDELYRAS